MVLPLLLLPPPLLFAAAAAEQAGFTFYPAANPGPGQAYWNASMNSWGGSVYNDSVRASPTDYSTRAW